MIDTCKRYLTDGGNFRVWELKPEVLKQKVKDCSDLYDYYFTSYHKVKDDIERGTGDGPPLVLSEMYIFGKFISFVDRIKKVFHCIIVITDAMNISIHFYWNVLLSFHLGNAQLFCLNVSLPQNVSHNCECDCRL